MNQNPSFLGITNTEPWVENARCREIGPDLFYTDDTGDATASALARRVCNGTNSDPCPVRDSCLEWALRIDDRYGVLGGKTPRQRQLLASARRQNLGGRECRVCSRRFQDNPNVLECSRECRLKGRRQRERKPA